MTIMYGDGKQYTKINEVMLPLMSKEFENSMSYEYFYQNSLDTITDQVKMTVICSIGLLKKEFTLTLVLIA